MKRILLSIIIAAFLSLFTFGFAVAPQANAAATMCAQRGCDVFANGPKVGFYHVAPGYTPVQMVCWRDASWYAGTNRWFKVNGYFGSGVWVSANQVINQTRVPRC